MDYIAHLEKLRRFRAQLPKEIDWLTRVITNKNNAPYLSHGDLVAFKPESEKIIQPQTILLFVFDEVEIVGHTKQDSEKIFFYQGASDFEYRLAESAHKLSLISKS